MEGIRTLTGNETVDRLSRMNITGNVIPAAWYQTIRKPTGKPYLNAIVILSDIVYWYRAAEVRDEGSGQLLGYRKRFKADLLQRSYQQMADQFGITKRDATNAVVELERLGVVRRVFRTMIVGGQTVPNILFLELDADVLERLTFPEEYGGTNGPGTNGSGTNGSGENEPVEKTRENGSEERGPGENEPGGSEQEEKKATEGKPFMAPKDSVGEARRGCHSKWGHLPPESGRGITEIRDTSHQDAGDGLTQIGETNTENTYRDYNTDYPIQSYQQAKEAFKKQIEYDILIRDRKDEKELDELVEIATEVLTSTAGTIRVNREARPAELVKEQYRKLNMFHIQYVLNCLQETETKARNIRAVMITALYNAVNTIGAYYGNLYQYHSAQGNKTDSGG